MPENKKNSEPGNNKKIVSEVVDTLKPEIAKHIETLRKDLFSDLKSILTPPQPQQAPPPSQQSPQPDIQKMITMLTGADGQLDTSKIGTVLAQLPAAGPAQPPLDLNKMSEGQLKYMAEQDKTKMLMTILPLIFSQQQQQSPLMAEMMQRIFLEKIGSSIYFDKMILQTMGKQLGAVDLLNSANNMQNNMTQPITDAISNIARTPLGTAAGGQK